MIKIASKRLTSKCQWGLTLAGPGSMPLLTNLRFDPVMGSLSSDSHTIGTMFDNGGLYYNHYLNGSVDEMRIYSRALAATEILALYNQSGGSSP
jgi:hypothetical protein